MHPYVGIGPLAPFQERSWVNLTNRMCVLCYTSASVENSRATFMFGQCHLASWLSEQEPEQMGCWTNSLSHIALSYILVLFVHCSISLLLATCSNKSGKPAENPLPVTSKILPLIEALAHSNEIAQKWTQEEEPGAVANHSLLSSKTLFSLCLIAGLDMQCFDIL